MRALTWVAGMEPPNGDYQLRLALLLVKKGGTSGAGEELETSQRQDDRNP